MSKIRFIVKTTSETIEGRWNPGPPIPVGTTKEKVDESMASALVETLRLGIMQVDMIDDKVRYVLMSKVEWIEPEIQLDKGEALF